MTTLLLAVGLTVLSGWAATGPIWRDKAAATAVQATPAVTVVLKERFPQAHVAAVVRRTPGANGSDVIALKRSAASPELLAIAMATVAKSRDQEGSAFSRRISVIIPLGLKYPPLQAGERTRMTGAITRLLAEPARAVPGVGHVPAISLGLTQ